MGIVEMMVIVVLKRNLKMYAIVAGFFWIIFNLGGSLDYLTRGIINEMFFWFISSTILFFMGFLIIYLKHLFKNKKLENKEISSEHYHRQIPSEYSVVIASLLLDKTHDSKVDIPALIISMIGKNILKYDQENKQLEVCPIPSDMILSKHEKCVYKSIKNNDYVGGIKFQALVLADAEKLGLITFKNNFLSHYKMLVFFVNFIFILICILLYFVLSYSSFLSILFILIILFYVMNMIFNSTYTDKKFNSDHNIIPFKLTQKGEDEAYKLKGLKNFVKDCTALSEREFKELPLWQDYLAYTIIFGFESTIYDQIASTELFYKII